MSGICIFEFYRNRYSITIINEIKPKNHIYGELIKTLAMKKIVSTTLLVIFTLMICYSQNVTTKNTAYKYIYVKFKIKEPKLHHTDAEYILGLDGSSSRIPEFNSVSYENYIVTSEIQKIFGYNEDKGYEYMDQIETSVRQQVSIVNINFDGEVFVKVRDSAEQERLKEYKAKIIDRKILVFNSYKEASIHRSNNKEEF
jgi:hypothetical protein